MILMLVILNWLRSRVQDDCCKQAISRFDRLVNDRLVNELYKKGCQEKTSAPTGGRVNGLDLQPTVCVSAPRFAQGYCSGRFALPVVFSAGGANAHRV
jgi:hypothetical protein